MKKIYLLVLIILTLFGFSGTGALVNAAAVAEGEFAFTRQNFMDVSVEKDGVFIFLENFSRSKIKRNNFPGHCWEWVVGINNINPYTVTIEEYSVVFENDAREAFVGPRPQSGGPIKIGQGEEKFIFLKGEFWGRMPARRTGMVNIFFTIAIGEGRSKDFKRTIRLD
ncbi:DUF3568 domain-containing protein [Patescibacteria group bacterium]|nr:DUF3568 domain-containing protein [Patescibacteria group bacterium]